MARLQRFDFRVGDLVRVAGDLVDVERELRRKGVPCCGSWTFASFQNVAPQCGCRGTRGIEHTLPEALHQLVATTGASRTCTAKPMRTPCSAWSTRRPRTISTGSRRTT